MIRVSDQVEERLKEVADGRSMSATIEKMLAYCSSPEGFCPAPQDTGSYEPYLLEQMNKRFDELKALIEDTTVDRVAAAGGRAPGGKEWVKWEQMQYIIFNREDDDPAWVIPEGAVFSFKNGDPNELAYYIKNGTIYIDGPQPVAILKVTPDIREAIDKHFTFND